MNLIEPQGSSKSVLGRFLRKRSEKTPQPASSGSWAPEARLQTETFLHHDTNGYGKPGPQRPIGASRKPEGHVRYNPEQQSKPVAGQSFRYDTPDARRQEIRNTSNQGIRDPRSASGTAIGVRAPKRPSDAVRPVYFFDASHQTGPEKETPVSRQWMDNLQTSIYRHIDPFDAVDARRRGFKPVRIAILDSGFDPRNPLLLTENNRLDPRIKDARSFIKGTASNDIRDEIGHGTHALGLLLNIATCAEIYIARVANRESLDRNTYDDITKAINHAVTEWKVDIISTSFGVREYNAPMAKAISSALNNQTLVFAAASNDGANFGRPFPAKHPSVFGIHSTDGHGNPSSFNPTADERAANFGVLGENVSSHWPVGLNGHNEPVKTMSGTSIATPIAAGLAAAILTFARQQEQQMSPGPDLLAPWLKDFHAMDAVLKSMVKQRRGGYDYIVPHALFDKRATREQVYEKIKDVRKHLYD